MILHATLVADRVEGHWRGALIRGPSGAGKSTLALRCLQLGLRLVADDRVVVWRSAGALYGKAPAPLAGLIEVRGVGVLPAPPALTLCRIALVIDLGSAGERLPEPATRTVAEVAIAGLDLLADDPHAALRLRAALAAPRHGL